MEEFKTILELVKSGYAIPFLFYLFWKDHKEAREEKISGLTMDSLNNHLNSVDTVVQKHLEKEAIEDLERVEMKKDIEYQRDRMTKSEAHTENIYKLLSEIKTMMIETATRRRSMDK